MKPQTINNFSEVKKIYKELLKMKEQIGLEKETHWFKIYLGEKGLYVDIEDCTQCVLNLVYLMDSEGNKNKSNYVFTGVIYDIDSGEIVATYVSTFISGIWKKLKREIKSYID